MVGIKRATDTEQGDKGDKGDKEVIYINSETSTDPEEFPADPINVKIEPKDDDDELPDIPFYSGTGDVASFIYGELKIKINRLQNLFESFDSSNWVMIYINISIISYRSITWWFTL